MSGPELLPCPFCGGRPRYQIDHTTEQRNSVLCVSCDFGISDPDDTGNVVAAWNRRAAPTLAAALAVPEVKALVEALKYIENMGQSSEPDHWNFRVHARNRARAARAALAALDKGAAP